MAPRPAWKGYLKLSLVTCAVELTSATTQADKIRFRVLNRKTGNRVRRQYIDAESGKPVDEEKQVKGYETEKNKFLLIEEEDLDAVQIESSHTLNLDGFVEKSDIEQVYLDTPYYLTPADKVSEEAFAVIREALARKKMAGLARIVLYRRERPVLIEPLGLGMLLTTLRYQASVREPAEIFGEVKDVEVEDEMLALAKNVIDGKPAKFDPSKFEDRYEKSLVELVEAKQKGRKPPRARPAAKGSNVVNLFEALKQSLGEAPGGKKQAAAGTASSKAGSKPPAKKAPGKTAAKKAPAAGKRKSA